MKPDHFVEDEQDRAFDVQDLIVMRACIFVAMAFAWFVFVHFIY